MSLTTVKWGILPRILLLDRTADLPQKYKILL